MTRILVVDDNEQNVYMLQVLLKGYGYEVITAINGAEALEKARLEPPDMIISDILMPVMDGFTLCREWKKDKRLNCLPFVFYTATYTDSKDEDLALSLGADRFIIKPKEPDVFVKILNEAIEGQEARLSDAQPTPVMEESTYLKQYNETLIRKLEDKLVQLQESREHYRKLANSISDIFFAVNRDLECIYWNLASEELLGIPADHAIGKPIHKLLSIAVGMEVKKICQEALVSKQQHSEEIEFNIRGESHVFDMHLYPSEDGLSVFARDITIRKKTEEQLHRSTHALGERVKELQCLYGMSHLVEEQGNSLEDIIQGTLQLIPSSWQYPEITCARIILNDGQFATANFRETPWKQAGNIFVKGQKIGALEVCYLEEKPTADEGPFLKEERRLLNAIVERLGRIVERKQTAAELRESEEQFRQFFENAPDYFYMISLDGVILNVNNAALRCLGYRKEELIGRPLKTIYAPESQQKMNQVLRKWKDTGELRDEEMVILTKKGDRRHVLLSVDTVRDKDGAALHSTSVQKDITELKAAQSQIVQQERLGALGQLASGIAHDFNNALVPIMGYTELLLDRPEVLDDRKKVNGYLKLMNTAAEDARNTVSRLREFYRPREDYEALIPVELNQVVEEAVQLTQPKWKNEAQASGITINMETDLREASVIEGSEAELREALTNLIINSVDAMDTSGTIALRTRTEGRHTVIEVSDAGIGMAEEVRERCFEPFFSTKGESGTGLGLAMVHGIIHRHGGTIEVESEIGKGTTFMIRFPQTEQYTEEVIEDARVHTRPMHVLVVDDEPGVRDIVTRYLAVDGHTCEIAMNGREGLDKFRKGSFDLVITDRAMPDMDGALLTASIKQIAPKIPVVMLTGFGDIMVASAEMPEGVDNLVSKPITLAKFREVLAQIGDSTLKPQES